jgi:hypothetical protein
MTTYCSACRKLLSPGDLKCPWCGLPLTVMAMLALRARGHSPLFSLVVIGGPFSIVLLALSWIQQKHETANDNARERAADLTRAAYLALADSLATPATFTKRCGDPDAGHGGVSEADARDMDQAMRPTAKTFVYTRRRTTMDVAFIHDRSIPEGCQPTTLLGIGLLGTANRRMLFASSEGS